MPRFFRPASKHFPILFRQGAGMPIAVSDNVHGLALRQEFVGGLAMDLIAKRSGHAGGFPSSMFGR